MRLLFEHHWLVSTVLASVAFALSWKGLRTGQLWYLRFGLGVLIVALIAFVIGVLVHTPTEHADDLVSALVVAVEKNDSVALTEILAPDVLVVDQWKTVDSKGLAGAIDGMHEFHKRHTLQFNTLMRFLPTECADEVQVEISLLSRVSGVGTVPSRWRIIVAPNAAGEWRIISIDVLEILGRLYR